MTFPCPKCGRECTSKSGLARHKRQCRKPAKPRAVGVQYDEKGSIWIDSLRVEGRE